MRLRSGRIMVDTEDNPTSTGSTGTGAVTAIHEKYDIARPRNFDGLPTSDVKVFLERFEECQK